jgi:hypothetical protein
MSRAVLVAGLGGSLSVLASELKPHIDRIEPFLTDQVTIHFDTAANYTYQLQYLHLQTGNWSNHFVAPKVPFPNHYIIVDYRTNGMRLYRLRATP